MLALYYAPRAPGDLRRGPLESWSLTAGAPIRVLCVEDNELVAEAIGRKLSGHADFEWLGWVNTAESLYERVEQTAPDVVCMDLDIPGQDAFGMIRALKDKSPHTRVLILSGFVQSDYIDRAVHAGAWGYLSKAEESRVIVDAFRKVAAGSFVMGRHSQVEWKATPAPPVSSPKARWSLLRLFRG